MLGSTAPPVLAAIASQCCLPDHCLVDHTGDKARRRALFYGADLVAQLGNSCQTLCNASLKTAELIDDVIQGFPIFGQPRSFDFAKNPRGA